MTGGKNWREFAWEAAAALAFCGALQWFARNLLWKLADSTFVLADWDGFREVAFAHAFGAVDWVARYLCAMTLAPGGFAATTALLLLAMTAAFAVRGVPAALAAWAPAALFAVPLLNLGDAVWLLRTPHFIHWNLLWFAMLAGVAAFAGWKGFAAAVAFVAAGAVAESIWLDLPAGEVLLCGFGLRPGFTWCGGDYVSIAAFAALAAAVAAGALPFTPPEKFRRRWALSARFGAPALTIALTAALCSSRDCRDQIEMERLVREHRFEEVLEVAPGKERPERMETAWRILAMYRTDRLDRDLHRYPMVGSYIDTKEEEMIMEGPLYLFEYGLVQPSRRWIFESISVKSWQPDYLRLLGDGAIVMGEVELAKRNYRQLARCPFRGDHAARRLAALAAVPPPPNAFDDLADVAGMHDVWCDHVARSKTVYFGNDRIVERFVYTLFLSLASCPPRMLKMVFASALLGGDAEMLKNNREALAKLYPDGRIGPVFLEAMK